ncbi:MAG: glycosyltransferase [Elusimicrobiota bacterium]|nr:glycosyltransferase [Elusimicrobiota bacterium]
MIYFLLAAYNEAESIEPVLTSIKRAIGGNFVILLVDDGSVDGTSDQAEAIARSLNINLKIIGHPRNLGLGVAIKTGFEWIDQNAAAEDIVVTMDCDDTHPPETVNGMIKKLDCVFSRAGGAGVVIASRFVKDGSCRGVSFARSFISRAGSFFMSLFFYKSSVSDWTSGFRVYEAGVLKKAGIPSILREKGFSVQLEILFILLAAGVVVDEYPLEMDYSLKKSSSKMRLFPLLIAYMKVMGRFLFAKIKSKCYNRIN